MMNTKGVSYLIMYKHLQVFFYSIFIHTLHIVYLTSMTEMQRYDTEPQSNQTNHTMGIG